MVQAIIPFIPVSGFCLWFISMVNEFEVDMLFSLVSLGSWLGRKLAAKHTGLNISWE